MLALIEALRPTQWIKNLNLFAAAILAGKVFEPITFIQSTIAFITFCLLSSSSYLVNDLADIKNDRLHPAKKLRPLARGDVTQETALFTAAVLLITGLGLAFSINQSFFYISLLFIVLQYFYSFVFKKKAVIDIIGIAFFFILRAFAGEIATGYHLPIWIMLTVIFLSLFIASGKRRSELSNSGRTSRQALNGYGKSLLSFYVTMFAVCTLISYAMFTFLAQPLQFDGQLHNFLLENYSSVLDRKWYMITLLPVIFGIMRYGQIIFELSGGERPERIVTTDIPLIFSVLVWGLMMMSILYVI
ncbi:hypothetical protein CO009_00920 [Candidatus Shapirobacteria bacterium CG_4_8_14_3_um_filter_35_11]|uniref:Decaprenyl-phosphate phosphoribosyltransferase n=5 Tax=Candidatus Shapironibacteriota TaxID=1752721 RepID=A0A1J5HMY3_9BACT|nr:MAG: hypothetical protein AUK05_03020 [Candidatus Shapirobacteria bacterium CG2_30_35_20]PIV07184.1 MAG: hypothetical protein COS53_02945 [Candidatus Shapirobacteria bacterium CG03_land_8_20_14_0_80_35_14]PJA51324.1 MAG: hypothetical protein CO168_00395 [Candidatus Shapirobacteria bacterium CG_4_9_14_3_um_filter_36_12]PJC80883.1 MAG: hypothetical protein CO009_00920 [Candidatus Shapirobacteria bacterium CG_4_8_14_3_um_filter_35_11]PJE66491.1 MAG: hypothetical protein COU93_04050 [Candidatus 